MMRVGVQASAAQPAASSAAPADVRGATPTQTSEFARQLRANKSADPTRAKPAGDGGPATPDATAAHHKSKDASDDAAAAAAAGAIPSAVATLADTVADATNAAIAAATMTTAAAAAAAGGGAGGATGSPASLGASPVASASAAAPSPDATAALASAASANAAAATPLEQAVHELLAGLPGYDGKSDKPKPATTTPAGATPTIAPTTGEAAAPAGDAPKAAAPAPIAPPTPMPESANPSHVHLVLDDGVQRVVMTVAVRGSEVNVALRSSDDHTATALARNAAALDDAMRGHGLELGQLASEHDRAGADKHSRRSPSRDADHTPTQHDEPFELEENL